MENDRLPYDSKIDDHNEPGYPCFCSSCTNPNLGMSTKEFKKLSQRIYLEQIQKAKFRELIDNE